MYGLPRELGPAVLTALSALLLSVLLTRLVLEVVRRRALGQQVRADGPATHQVKQGTPSLGGLAILAAAAVAAQVSAGVFWTRIAQVLGLAVLFALIGLADDLAKLRRGSTRGLPARYRIVLELVLAALFAWWIHPPPATVWGFSGLAAAGGAGLLAWGALAVFTIVGAANALNFTDGVDGLAATLTALCATVLAVGLACSSAGHALVPAAVALAGAAAGFLWFNSHPAKIFMGDVGSLGMGALLGGLAVAAGLELFFALAALVFVIEVVSVILQVIYFRSTGGKRLFRMTPIHHAFELRGWKEPQLVARFALVGLLAGGLALAALLYTG